MVASRGYGLGAPLGAFPAVGAPVWSLTAVSPVAWSPENPTASQGGNERERGKECLANVLKTVLTFWTPLEEPKAPGTAL